MTKTLWSSLFAAACLLIVSCTTSGGRDNGGSTEGCSIGEQGQELNHLLAGAGAPGGDIRAVVAANHARIAQLAAAASAGAQQQGATAREVSCRSIALRAYGAVLYSPDEAERQAAIPAISQTAEEGRAACQLLEQQNHMDAGAAADCDLIDMWFFTKPTLDAGLALQAIQVRPGLEPVGDATWDEIAGRTHDAASGLSAWSTTQTRTTQMRPVVEEHRRRVVCHTFAPLVQMRNLSGRGSPGWQRVYATEYPAFMSAAAAAVRFPPAGDDAALAVEQFCGPFAPR